MTTCPFCGLDPYEYVDVGIGSIPVAVTCCELGYWLYDGGEKYNHSGMSIRKVLLHSAVTEIVQGVHFIWSGLKSLALSVYPKVKYH